MAAESEAASTGTPIEHLSQAVLGFALDDVLDEPVARDILDEEMACIVEKLMDDAAKGQLLVQAVAKRLQKMAEAACADQWDLAKGFSIQYHKPVQVAGVDYFLDDLPSGMSSRK